MAPRTDETEWGGQVAAGMGCALRRSKRGWVFFFFGHYVEPGKKKWQERWDGS